MDKTEILRILTGLDDTRAIAEVHFDMSELGERAEAIAQAAEEELIEQDLRWKKKWAEETIARQEAYAALLARVAVMAKAISAIPEWDKPYTDGVCAFCGNVRMEGHRDDCPREQALSAAPKVVWHGIGHIALVPGGPQGELGAYTVLDVKDHWLPLEDKYIDGVKDGQHVQVFVVKCSRTHEQSQESEQEG